MSLEDANNFSMKSLKSVMVQSKMIEDMKKLQFIHKDIDEDTFDPEEDIDDPFDMEDFNPGAKNQD